MATNFPTGLDALTNPTGSSALTSPDHATQHADANDAIEALQSKVGVDGSAVTSSLDYKVENGVLPKLNVDNGTLFVDATNDRVGVGTSTPSAKLDIQTSTGTAVRITNSGVGETLRIEDATGDTTPLVIDSAGNVGLGTATPSARLHITDGSANIRLNLTGVGADSLNIVAPVAGLNNRSLTLRPVSNMPSSNILEFPHTTGELAAFTSARGTNTGWITFSPTITQNVIVAYSTYVSRYCQIGKLVHYQFALYISGTGVAGNSVRVSLPQTFQANATYAVAGTMHIYDASSNVHYSGPAFAASPTQVGLLPHANSNYFGTGSIAITTGDVISGHIIYEAA